MVCKTLQGGLMGLLDSLQGFAEGTTSLIYGLQLIAMGSTSLFLVLGNLEVGQIA
jgi:hypothetical protein